MLVVSTSLSGGSGSSLFPKGMLRPLEAQPLLVVPTKSRMGRRQMFELAAEEAIVALLDVR
jgi:hypothetical protein